MTEQTKALAPQQEAYVQIRNFLQRQSVLSEVRAVAASHLNPERVLSLILSHTRRSDLLLKCTPESLLECVIRCARLGIEPTGAAGGMYIVPFKGSKKMMEKGKEKWLTIYIATPISDYRAEIDLAARTGLAEAVEPRIIYDGDEWTHEEGMSPSLVHKPGKSYQVEGKEQFTYARALLPSGRYTTEVLYKPEIERRRKMSRSGNNDNAPWAKHYWRMALKSAVRALCNRLPKSAKFFDSTLAHTWMQHTQSEAKLDFGEGDVDDPLVIDTEVVDSGLPSSGTDDVAARLQGKAAGELTEEEKWELEQKKKADNPNK